MVFPFNRRVLCLSSPLVGFMLMCVCVSFCFKPFCSNVNREIFIANLAICNKRVTWK